MRALKFRLVLSSLLAFLLAAMIVLMFAGVAGAPTLVKPKATTPPAPDCSKGTSLNVVAHEDDDILFMNPDIQQDISAGRCVTTLFVTVGDYGHGNDWHYIMEREHGPQAAYAEMAAMPNEWAQTDTEVSGHAIVTYELRNDSKIRLMFMRLPNSRGTDNGFAIYGYQTLQQLYVGKLDKIFVVHSSSSYTSKELISTLAQLFRQLHPKTIRSQDFTQPFNKGDHSDHVATALFVLAANENLPFPHTLTSYKDYSISQLPQNLSPADVEAKDKTWLVYTPFDPFVCSNLVDCSHPQNQYYSYYKWLEREYVADVITTR